ncbi:MAG TPA: extracellular solute-binding protein [Candidatus Mediterraneibacter merdipullorum]|nr:extracellular solute-binding protein [Candidatus Mediterraneibacter merdipullorum]
MKKKVVSVLLSVLMITGLTAGCGGGTGEGESTDGGTSEEPRELSLLVDTTNAANEGFLAIVDLAEEELNMTINVETRPAGTEGDNVVKTRLASGDMADLCVYNSGALLNAINPSEYFIDLSDQEFMDRVDDLYKEAVSVDEAVYGIPFATSRGEAVLYNKEMYEKYGLEIPKTWDEFLANCDVLQEAGETAVLGTFADAWTAQIVFLGDAYNLLTAVPDFPEKFDAGEMKWASTPEGLRSFEKLGDTTPYYNEDYLSMTYDEGCDVMVSGGAGHWFAMSNALSAMYTLYEDMDMVNNLGMFAIPGDDADVNGITMWYPVAIYGNKNSENQDAILDFMEFYISEEALDAYCGATLPDGPFCVKDYEIPVEAYAAVSDIQAYIDAGNYEPALEYISQVKGADCPAICQELASGQTTAEEAAAKYDDDCAKAATQLGLDW